MHCFQARIRIRPPNVAGQLYVLHYMSEVHGCSSSKDAILNPRMENGVLWKQI